MASGLLTAALPQLAIAASQRARAASGGASSGGCAPNDRGGEIFRDSDVYRFARTPAGDPIKPAGDVIPNNFFSNGVVQAWAQGATGAGVTIASVDTGVFPEQSQLRDGFSPPTTASAGRSAEFLNFGLGSADRCNHGTRAAGTATAPWDGRGIVGVAWKANLLVVKIADAVVLNAVRARRMAAYLRMAVEGRARLRRGADGAGGSERMVISMAVGDYPIATKDVYRAPNKNQYRVLQNTIKDLYRRYDVLFVGAAGSVICTPDNQVAFPARLREVLAVTAAVDNDTVHETACGGPEVDLAIQLDDRCTRSDGQYTGCKSVPAPGRRVDDLVQFNASSDATAVMSGIAALVWSKHPDWTREQVWERLIESGTGLGSSMLGKGIIDAGNATDDTFRWVAIRKTPYKTEAGQQFWLTARHRGYGPFSYRWSTGETTKSISGVAGGPGSRQTLSVTVTDLSDGTQKSGSISVQVPRTNPKCRVRPDLCEDKPEDP